MTRPWIFCAPQLLPCGIAGALLLLGCSGPDPGAIGSSGGASPGPSGTGTGGADLVSGTGGLEDAAASVTGGASGGEAATPSLPPLGDAPARPLDSGMLAVAPDGRHALASDPIGLTATVIAIESAGLSAVPVPLPSEPGRSVLSDHQAFVPLPRAGMIALISLADGTLTELYSVCPAPEGLALAEATLHVACRDGQLLSLSAETGEVTRRVQLERDLRDVVVHPGGLAVSRLASAELLVLDAQGALVERLRPQAATGIEAAVAWRTIPTARGTIAMAHQLDFDDGFQGSYGGGFCGSMTAPTITEFDLSRSAAPSGSAGTGPGLDPRQVLQLSFTGGAGTLDFAPLGSGFVLAVPGNALAKQQDWRPPPTDLVLAGPVDPGTRRALWAATTEGSNSCIDLAPGADQVPLAWQHELDVPIAVAHLAQGPFAGQTLVLTHSPQAVHLLGADFEPGSTQTPASQASVLLSASPRESTGLALFQMTVGAGISCASCHPLGRPDARSWRLLRGPRRTQSLEGGVSALGAFHWDAEFSSFGDLLDDVLGHRMGLGVSLPEEAETRLLDFVDSIPGAVPPEVSDPEARQRGEELFFSEQTECGTCHGGESYTDNRSYDVGTGGLFVTPSLLGVAYRAPLLHDGCAEDLQARFGLCGGGDRHGKTTQLSPEQIADLVAFMDSL